MRFPKSSSSASVTSHSFARRERKRNATRRNRGGASFSSMNARLPSTSTAASIPSISTSAETAQRMIEKAREKREAWQSSAENGKGWLQSVPVFGNALDKTEKLAEHLAANVSERIIDKAGDALGVDLDNPKSIGAKLDEVERAVTAPENVEKAKEIVKKTAQTGLIALQASKPFVDEFIEEATPIAQKGMEKATKATLATGVNILEDFLGPIIGIPRTLMSAAEAFRASLNTGSELVKKGTEMADASMENYDRIKGEMERVGERAVGGEGGVEELPFQHGGGARRKKAARQYTKHRRTRETIEKRVQDAFRSFAKTVRLRKRA